MADEQSTDSTSAPANPAQANQAAGILPLNISPQYIKDLSFESPNAPGSVMAFSQSQPDINVNVDVGVNQAPNNAFEVVLVLTMEAKHGDTTDFLVELQYCGLCTLGEVPENLVQPILFVEVPRLLFPFARQIVTSAVREAGFPPVMMNPIDFGMLYKQKVDQMAAQQSAAAQNGGAVATAPADGSDDA